MGRSKSRAVRKIAPIKAQLRAGDAWVAIVIGNISATGLMAKCTTPPAPGTAVEIRRRGSVLTGRVVWSTASRFGMVSAEPIDVAAQTAGSGLQVQQSDQGPVPKRLWHWRSKG
jgi:hypothetical protein